MKPLPVLLACQQLNIGGSERQLAETARALDRSRFTPHVAAFHARGVRMDELRQAGVPVLALPVRSFRDLTAVEGARALRRYVREHNIGLIHSFDVPLNVFTTASFAVGSRPVILTSQRGHRALTGNFYRRLSRVADRLTNGIVVNCEYMRRHLMQEENVRPEMIDLCYNGIDISRFPAPSHDMPEKTPGLCIGVVCALRREKDIPTLLRAFGILQASHPEARLMIVGSGPEHGALTQIAQELGIVDAVTFRPAVGDVAPSLHAMDIFVLPSRDEALSNAIIEAMACGTCVVASNVGGNPELTGGNGERGLLFPAGDHAALAARLIDLAANAGQRRDLAGAARQWVERELAMPVAAARMAAIYEKRLAAS